MDKVMELLQEYKDIQQNYVGKNGYEYYWDDIAEVPYLYNAGKQEFISYDDARSIENKALYVMERGLGGVMIWELSCDNGDLIQAIHKGFGETPEPTPDPDPVPDPVQLPVDGLSRRQVVYCLTQSRSPLNRFEP